MSMIARAKPEDTAPTERTLGRITVSSDSDQWTLKLDAAAATYGNILMIVSAVGQHTHVQALRAMLAGAARATFKIEAEGYNRYAKHSPYAGGYKFHTHKLGFSTYHLLAIAKYDGLLPTMSDEAIYQEFKSERYTTPLVRDFIPWIRDQLTKTNKLVPLTCFQCEAGILNADESHLDQLVEAGVTFGQLQIR